MAFQRFPGFSVLFFCFTVTTGLYADSNSIAKMLVWTAVPWVLDAGLGEQARTSHVASNALLVGEFSAAFQSPILGIVSHGTMRAFQGDQRAGFVATYVVSKVAANLISEELDLPKSQGHFAAAGLGVVLSSIPLGGAMSEFQAHMAEYTIVSSLADSGEAYWVEQGYTVEQAALTTGLVLAGASGMAAQIPEARTLVTAMALESGFRVIPTLLKLYAADVTGLIGVPLMIFYARLANQPNDRWFKDNFFKGTGQALAGAVFVRLVNGLIDWLVGSKVRDT